MGRVILVLGQPLLELLEVLEALLFVVAYDFLLPADVISGLFEFEGFFFVDRQEVVGLRFYDVWPEFMHCLFVMPDQAR